MPTPPRAPKPRRVLAAWVLSLVGVLVALLGVGAPATASTVAAAPSATTSDAAPLVLIGTSGLRWDDVGTLTTPALWGMSREGAVGNLVPRSVHSTNCPADGWLAVSGGTRAADLVAEDRSCRTLRDPVAGGPVPAWSDYLESAAAESYGAQLGLLGDTLAAAGTRVVSIGPGAAIAVADADGVPVGEHQDLPWTTSALEAAVRRALVGDAQLVVVDVGAVRDPGRGTTDRLPAGLLPTETETSDDDMPALTGPDAVTEPTRGEQAQAIDARVGAVLAGIAATRTDTTVLAMSLSDSGRQPQLQLAAASGPLPGGDGTYSDALLAAASTRQPGYVQATDVTPTLLTTLGLRDDAPAGVLVGTTITTTPGPALASARVAKLVDDNRHVQAVTPLVPRFYVIFVAINLILYGLVTVGLNGRVLDWWGRTLDRWVPRAGRRALAASTDPALVLRQLRVAGVAVAAIPVATLLANLTPWWRVSPPSYALTLLIVGWVLVITAVALLPRWRRWLLGPLGVVAGVTAVVVAADVATGANLQLESLMGTRSLVAGRFYGFNNTAFALFAAASVLLAVALANPLVARGRRRAAVGVVAAIGIVATLLDGLPSIGADFGGPPALVPGFAVLALLAAGVRLNWWRVLGVLVAGAVTVTLFAVLDWLRPADSRTHLGRFVETVLDGGLWPVVGRKLAQNVDILFKNELTLLAIGGLVVVVLVLGRPLRTAVGAPDGGAYRWLSSGAPLARLGTDAPMLRAGLVALAITLGIGFAFNDSGVVIPAIGIALTVPLLVAACANWMLLLRPGAANDPAQISPAGPGPASGRPSSATPPQPSGPGAR
ncbi:hypothetical protein ACGIF2_11320 [Cellulomonas sp. P22]|uniref:hypothetical protein n=1 Tax=Cellulomonas sp. P22 TaxID=3373189 RepID=UPI003792DCCE